MSLILPTEANTSSSNEKFNALWLSPDEWLIYFDDDDKNRIFLDLNNEIDLFVRRSFSEHLYSWMNDSARFI